jgi:catechol 2,3-dioxygenase-like lactoylglutathione lyase family enzyme
MIAHTTLPVRDYPTSKAFYSDVLGTLGYQNNMESGRSAGGKDNGGPGYRNYSPGYYAAFALDSDGNNIEAVWYDPRKAKAE